MFYFLQFFKPIDFQNQTFCKIKKLRFFSHKILKLHSLKNFHWQKIFYIYIYIFLIGIHSKAGKAEQPLRGMELQEKEAQKDYSIQEIYLEKTYS